MPIILDETPPLVPKAATPPDYVQHFSWPFRFQRNGDGSISAATVEQDTLDEVFSCVQAIIACPVGFRDELPPFGTPLPEFAQVPVDPAMVQQAIARWEPRADASAIEYADVQGVAYRHVQLGVTATGGENSLPPPPPAGEDDTLIGGYLWDQDPSSGLFPGGDVIP